MPCVLKEEAEQEMLSVADAGKTAKQTKDNGLTFQTKSALYSKTRTRANDSASAVVINRTLVTY